MRDDRIRHSLERLPVPPEAPSFFDGLWREAEASERRAARRWRRTSIALSVIVITAGTAAGVFAVGRAGGETVVDQTLSCPVPGIADALDVGVRVKWPMQHGPPGVGIGSNVAPGVTFVGFPRYVLHANTVTYLSGAILDRTHCRTAPRQIPLSHAGLRAQWVLQNNRRWVNVGWSCSMTGFASIRLRATLGKSGSVTAAQLALSSGGKLRAYIDWTPTFASP